MALTCSYLGALERSPTMHSVGADLRHFAATSATSFAVSAFTSAMNALGAFRSP